jgi:ABC-2 type transport system permease protein
MSPIHDQSYRHYEGTRRPLGRAWAVIAKSGMRTMLSRKWFLVLMVFAWIPFLIQAVRLYIAANIMAAAGAMGARQASAIFAVTPQTFRSFLSAQGVFIFFVTIYVGSGLIANDRRANALQIYLAKPLMRIEYILGKLAVLVVFLASVTLVPGLLLLLLQAALSGSFEFVRTNLFLVPAITLGCLLEVIIASSTMLALSSLSKSSRYAALLYTGAIFFTDAVFNALRVINGSTRMAWVSITANMAQVTDVIFRQPGRYETPWLVSLLVLVALVALSISVLERRVRGVEVVS